MELTYTKCGDYLIPDLVLSDTKEYHIGKYGRLRRAYLKEHRPILYTDLIVTEKLFPHLEEIDIACQERLEIIEKAMMQQEGVTEALKAADQMAWVRSMNSIHNRAEEIVLLIWSTVEGGNAMILEAMYNGEFYPCETVVPTSPEYRKAVQTCAALMEQLSQRLSKEDYALVEELRAQNAIAQCEESESHFKYGFSAGLIVQQEAYEQLQNKK